MASEYARYQQKVARKKRAPESDAKFAEDVKPLAEPRAQVPRKRH